MPDHSFPSLWLNALSFGVRPGMPFSLRRKIYLTNAAAFSTILLSVFFAIDNARRPDLWHLLPYNLALIVVCGLALFLVWRGFQQAAFLLETFAFITVFSFTGALYFNSSENYLLLIMTAVVFVIDRRSLRHPIVLICALTFIGVKVSHYGSFEFGRVPLDRYVINTTFFTASFYIFLEIFRGFIRDYLRQIEDNNAKLARQQLELSEERARLNRANQSKEKLFSMLAHDLRGPVGNLKVALEGLEDGLLDPADFRELQSDLRRDVQRVYSSLDDLLLWAAGQMEAIEPEPENIELRLVAQETLDLLSASADAKHIRLENRLPAGGMAHADWHQTGAIIRNLLANAIKFTPEGGVVAISAKLEGKKWVIAIADNGVGMNAETLASLFDSDVAASVPGTRNEKGWGLGLQICRDFVAANGGRIWAESEPGLGTTFYFTLASAG